MKTQCLSYFVVMLATTTKAQSLWWKLYLDGSPNTKGIRAGVILESPNGIILVEATNNQAEYETLLAGQRLAKEVGAKHVKCWSDSKLVNGQLNGNFQTKDSQMTRYFHLATQLKETFTKFELRHVVKENNERDNLLSRLASTRNNRQHRTVIQETISQPSLNKMVMSVTIVDLIQKTKTYIEEASQPLC